MVRCTGGGGGLMRGIKIPQQDFAQKMQGGELCTRGDTTVHTIYAYILHPYIHTYIHTYIHAYIHA